MSDEPELTDGDGVPIPHEYQTEAIIEKLTSGDVEQELIGLRDYLIHELTVSRCTKCQASKLRTGDTAALVGKLQTALERIEEVRRDVRLQREAEAGEVTGVAAIRRRRNDAGRPAAENPSSAGHGSKQGPRRTSPHRRNARG